MLTNPIMMSYPPGAGGDIFRTLLLMIVTDLKFELEYDEDKFMINWPKVKSLQDADGNWKAVDFKYGLTQGGMPIAFINKNGQCMPLLQWFKDNDELLPDGYDENIINFYHMIRKSHHTQFVPINFLNKEWKDYSSKEYLMHIDKYCFITVSNFKYWEWILKSWSSKLSSGAWNIWTEEYKKFNEDDAETINNAISDYYKIYLDNFFELDKIKEELIEFCLEFDIPYYTYNSNTLKLFWQAWMDEQRIKVE
tara:strand:- start:2392 stop:3144 length:753 start_codon:yes stop_codon:yes gene_type:complete